MMIEGTDPLFVNQRTGQWLSVVDGIPTGSPVPNTYYVFNVKDYGAVGDNVTDDTAAIQATIAAADAVVDNFNSQVVYFPAGEYRVTGITSSNPHTYIGDGMQSSRINLINGSNDHVWTHFLPGDASGGDPPFFTWPSFKRITLNGNKANQVGSFHCLYMPDTAWGILTEYSLGAILNEVRVDDASGSGIYIGRNRNACIMLDVLSAECNDDIITNYAFDHHFFDVSGYGATIGYHNVESGACVLINCTYFTCGRAFVVEAGTNAYIIGIGLVLDGSQEEHIFIDGDNRQDMMYAFSNCLYNNMSLSSLGTFPAIELVDAYGASFIGSNFLKSAGEASYLINITGGGPVQWQGNYYRVDSDIPFATDITNDFDKLVLSGDVEVHVRRNSVGDVLIRPTTAGQTRAKGTPTNDNATAGDCGEFVSDADFNVSLTSGATSNISTISIGPGDWDVTASVVFLPDPATTTTQAAYSISTTSATHDFTVGGYAYKVNDSTGITGSSLFGGETIGPRRISVSVTTSLYLTATTIFITSVMAASGTIRARRVR